MHASHGDFEHELVWEKLYSRWSHTKNRYREFNSMGHFEAVRWRGRLYWGLDQPARLVMGEGAESMIHLDWWPSKELEERRQDLSCPERRWDAPCQPPAQASRYTLFFLWEAKNHAQADEALAAVWLAACLGMWNGTLPGAWRGPFVNILENYRHCALSRLRSLGIGEWSRPCRHLLPDSLAELYRKPEDDFEFIDMIAANMSYVLNRWTMVQLIPELGTG